ncbi:MAG: hypothetical protein P1U53_14640 [Sulfitobacter sp.]|nr:hypothetical protein [Sulfitobacter sp.]
MCGDTDFVEVRLFGAGFFSVDPIDPGFFSDLKLLEFQIRGAEAVAGVLNTGLLFGDPTFQVFTPRAGYFGV